MLWVCLGGLLDIKPSVITFRADDASLLIQQPALSFRICCTWHVPYYDEVALSRHSRKPTSMPFS